MSERNPQSKVAGGAPDALAWLAGTDIYLLDQLLRGRIQRPARVFDAGCGSGRNLSYFMRAGYVVSGVDRSAEAIDRVRDLARRLSGREAREGAFQVGLLEDLQRDERLRATAEVVVCNAVLHFAQNHEHFEAMLGGAWHVLVPGGLFFARLASTIGIEARVDSLGSGRFALPDGSERYLVDEAQLLRLGERLGAELLDPIKTTNVQNLRCMTTWVLRRRS